MWHIHLQSPLRLEITLVLFCHNFRTYSVHLGNTLRRLISMTDVRGTCIQSLISHLKLIHHRVTWLMVIVGCTWLYSFFSWVKIATSCVSKTCLQNNVRTIFNESSIKMVTRRILLHIANSFEKTHHLSNIHFFSFALCLYLSSSIVINEKSIVSVK